MGALTDVTDSALVWNEERFMSWRSLFFAPGNRRDLLSKFPRVSADNFVIDLEDGTPPDQKGAARASLIENVQLIRQNSLSGRLWVRVNTIGSQQAEEDLAVALRAEIDGVVLPKLEEASVFDWLEAQIHRARRSAPVEVVGGLESILGVLNARDCCKASRRLKAVYFGAEDLAAEAMLERTRESEEVLYARQHVVLAARAAGIAPIDQAVVDVHDDELFERDSLQARRFGYEGKICLNPRQATLAQKLFTPGATAVDRARRLLVAYEEGVAQGRGTIMFEGGMVDQPMVTRARAVLSASDEMTTRNGSPEAN
jgi:citrate lyase subunit beta/citryl-CoA lyase